jgi:hypothetical protein
VALIFSLIQLVGKKVRFTSTPFINRLLLVLRCKLIVSVIYFFVLYGDVQTNFMEIIVLATLYKIIYQHAIQRLSQNRIYASLV